MWLFTNSSFVSIVQDRDNPQQLWVRGRLPGDVEKFLGHHIAADDKVLETNDADYRFRCKVSRGVAAAALMDNLGKLDYTNFKSSIDQKSKLGYERHEIYLRVWSIMENWQRRWKKFPGGKQKDWV